MNIVQKAILRLDKLQRAHKPSAFLFAVIKKHDEDQAGYQAALVTYYGFLSLFPLLLVLTTVATIASSRNTALGQNIVESVSDYFPVFGKSLESSVHGVRGHGAALIFGFLFTLYGARGSADAFRNAVNHIWHIPMGRRSGFPKSLIRSFSLVFGAGSGFIAASIITGFAANFGHGFVFRGLSIVLNLIILYGVFILILRLSLPFGMPRSKFTVGAAISAVGLTIIQLAGSAILAHQAKSLSASGAIFATTLGLLAWIYLQTRLVMYAVVVDTVRDGKLWPRSLSGKNLTSVDKRIKEERSTQRY